MSQSQTRGVCECSDLKLHHCLKFGTPSQLFHTHTRTRIHTNKHTRIPLHIYKRLPEKSHWNSWAQWLIVGHLLSFHSPGPASVQTANAGQEWRGEESRGPFKAAWHNITQHMKSTISSLLSKNILFPKMENVIACFIIVLIVSNQKTYTVLYTVILEGNYKVLCCLIWKICVSVGRLYSRNSNVQRQTSKIQGTSAAVHKLTGKHTLCLSLVTEPGELQSSGVFGNFLAYKPQFKCWCRASLYESWCQQLWSKSSLYKLSCLEHWCAKRSQQQHIQRVSQFPTALLKAKHFHMYSSEFLVLRSKCVNLWNLYI